MVRIAARWCAAAILAGGSASAWAGRCDALPAVDRVLAVDARDREQRTYPQEQVLRDYALHAYRNIAGDVIDGRGPHLDTLRAVFAPVCGEPAALGAWLRDLLSDSASATDFARRMVIGRDLAVRGDETPGVE